jgi:hypothetical protein
MNAPPEWTGWPLGGVMRTPMLVGTTSAYLQFCFSSIFMKARRFFQTRPRVNHALAADEWSETVALSKAAQSARTCISTGALGLII